MGEGDDVSNVRPDLGIWESLRLNWNPGCTCPKFLICELGKMCLSQSLVLWINVMFMKPDYHSTLYKRFIQKMVHPSSEDSSETEVKNDYLAD